MALSLPRFTQPLNRLNRAQLALIGPGSGNPLNKFNSQSTKAASPAISGSTNPFEVDDKGSSRVGNTGAKEGSSEKEKQEGGEEGLLPPADLNDMDEFPPLHHATL